VARDPYQVLGVSPGCSDEALHDAYRRLVKRHHPDRNNGSAESTRRFQEIQAAYNEVRKLRAAGPRPHRPPPKPPPDDPAVESRMADLERELREAQAARERARQTAQEAVHGTAGRPSREDLGYYETDDSFTKILTDVRDEVSERLSGAREHPAVRRVSDLIEGLEGLTSRFDDKKR
jgi:curved DNA-binding protein CbpA